MGRSKPAPVYRPQAKTANIKRIPSFELPTYEHAVSQQQVIHSAFSNQPGYIAWTGVDPQPANYVNQQQYNEGTSTGANDQPMDIVYFMGDSGYVDYPMMLSSPSVDLMDVDIPEEDIMNVDDPNEMDIDHVGFYENITPRVQVSPCQSIVQTIPTDPPRPEPVLKPVAHTARRILPLKPPQRSPPTNQRPVLSPIHNVAPKRDFPQGPEQSFRAIDISIVQAVKAPPPAGTHSRISPPDDLEQIIQGLLKLNLSGSDIPSTVEPNVTILSPLSVVDNTPPSRELNTETLVHLSNVNSETTQSTTLPPTLPLTGVWEDLAGLENAFTAPNFVGTRASIDIVLLSSRFPKTFTDFFDLPNVNWEPAFKVDAYDQAVMMSKGSASKKYSPQKVKDLSKNAIFRQKGHSIKSLLLGSNLESPQSPRRDRVSAINDMTKKGFTAHNTSGNFSLRKALAKFRFNEAKCAASPSPIPNNAVVPVKEKLPVIYTDAFAQTLVLPSSSNKVPGRPRVDKVSLPPRPLIKARPRVPVRDTVIQGVLENYVWVDSALEISKVCQPEPQVVKISPVPIVSETPIPGDFLGSLDKAWCHARGQNFFSWLSLRILGW